MNWYIAVLKNYVGFSGRARRTEFLEMFFLFNILISIVLTIIGRFIDTHPPSAIYALAVLLPTWRSGPATARHRAYGCGSSGAGAVIGRSSC